MRKQQPRAVRWTRNGAIVGLVLAVLEAGGFWGDGYMAWEGAGIAANLGSIAGSIIGSALIFLLAAVVTNFFAKNRY